MGVCCSNEARTERVTSDSSAPGNKKERKRSTSRKKSNSKNAPKYHKGSTNDDDEAGDIETNDGNEDVFHKTAAHIALTEVKIELITIHIQQINGDTKQLPVMNTLTISQVKQLIAKHIGIPEHTQQLKYNDEILDTTQTIWSHEIQDGDIIHLTELETHDDLLEIIVDYKAGTITKTIFIAANSELIKFRKEVQGKIPNVSLNEQQFFYNDIELLDDNKLLKDYGLENGKYTLRFEWKSAI
eukprot:73048_1